MQGATTVIDQDPARLAAAHNRAAHAHLGIGALRVAETHARAAFELAERTAAQIPDGELGRVNLVAVLVARGSLEEAGRLADERWPLEPSETIMQLHPLVVRGELRTAQGRHAEAIADLLAAGQEIEHRDHVYPLSTRWETAVVAPMLELGRVDEACKHAHNALARARRHGSEATVGRALRTVALTIAGDRCKPGELLVESVKMLRYSPCRLELAHSLLELGTFLSTNGDAAARDQLAAALEVAVSCGADGLAARAQAQIEEAAAVGLDDLIARILADAPVLVTSGR
jgi:tetratricopeptide (TPR) repeat protein